ncbi:transcriptional repressor LexA [Myxococcota bacterium]|nr:transcriptional repressor LexA [Myxococcota bacterium]
MNSNIPTKLTRGQKRVLEALIVFSQNHGYPPSTRELAKILGIKAPSVHEQLGKLEEKGFIRRQKNKARTIDIVRTSMEPENDEHEGVSVPILGNIAAGLPLFAEEHCLGHLELPTMSRGRGRLFALRVRGDSMVDCGINDHDYVIVRQQPVAERGDIVAALLGDEATVKRLRIAVDSILLVPENSKYSPIDVTSREDFRILGKVIHTMKSE